MSEEINLDELRKIVDYVAHANPKKVLGLLDDIEHLRIRAEAAEKVIRGMYPLWIAAMSYGEHGRAADLDRIRNYYSGRDNPMTNEDVHLMFSLIQEKGG